jgi:CelD/BcsL family acetyltransferase involved in cellulose biosynthesis
MSGVTLEPKQSTIGPPESVPQSHPQVAWADNLDSKLLTAIDEGAVVDLFHTLGWFQNLFACGIDRGEGVLAAKVTNAGHAFLLPLQVSRAAKAAAFGRSVTSLSNYYSSLYGPIGDPAACTPAACRALARSLRDEVPHSAVIDLNPLDGDGPLLRHLAPAFAAEGYGVDTYFCFGNWYLPVLNRPWAEVERQIPSRQRNTIKRARKKLADAGEWTLKIHQKPGPELDQAIADYDAIYRRSWKQPEPFGDFVPSLCRWTAERGWLRLGVVRVGDSPVAAQIWFVHQRKALIFKLAYDESFKRLSAGSVLTAELFRHTIDVDHVDELDYLTGDDGYKSDWMTHRRERVGLLAFRKASLQGMASWARHAASVWRRKLLARRQAASTTQVAEGEAPDRDA